ncbi:class I SAM-dependent methyltransferase [Candidatus Sumerlaeota bacterium]|nr:class I SAM-dependent methyltransferase [Candidatus Sumerlaeota bacterium]
MLIERMHPILASIMVCPCCGAVLKIETEKCSCSRDACKAQFPIRNEQPILINEKNSLFDIDDFQPGKDAFHRSKFMKLLAAAAPRLGLNVKAAENYRKLHDLLLSQNERPICLVIGCGEAGKGIQELVNDPHIDIINTDVNLGENVHIVADGHDLPFKNESFDAVIAQAVLEHVAEPNRVVQEIYRVLKSGGLVYAETPFMQQIHMGAYDFTRFTLLGHRRLFRHFSSIELGACCGPGMALAWAYAYFLMSFAPNKKFRKLLFNFARVTAFWLKYFDYFLTHTPCGLDAASGCYFLGRKSSEILDDRDLIALYPGWQ